MMGNPALAHLHTKIPTMEASTFHIRTHQFCSPLSIPTTKVHLLPPQPVQICRIAASDRSLKLQRGSGRYGHGWWSVVECAKEGSVSEIEGELKNERNLEDEEWMGIGGRWRENCKERKGIIESIECLEREAIMGKDEGREAADYCRRAQIFDKSSEVFQALKESNTHHHDS